ncbi:hypothetical protein EHP00_215 [Ecytonucleospora hepatopenaei]|uniref:Uncharacterized protein n=1 Tax=Ecytonucleospora hepatopenaei TaxID=646526 RepID=A0A1W0E6Q6_9MICR|nr:hypothetical protein EHP00_215 [Ecytonucleospora hepatopenaei]
MKKKFYILPFSYKNPDKENLEYFFAKKKVLLRGEPFVIEPVDSSVYFYNKENEKIDASFFFLKSPVETTSVFEEGIELSKKRL